MDDQKFISTINVTDPENWEELKEKIGNILNFNVNNYRDKFLKRRVECRLRRNSIYSYEEYSKFLGSNDEEKEKLEKELTIHVTHFFRDVSLFRELQEWVFPQAIKEKIEKNDYSLYIWSAGSSTGEEAYSIAMILREVLGNNIEKFNINIRGSDLDQKTVSTAIMGIYSKESLTEIPAYYKETYLMEANGVYSVVPEIKRMVKFEVDDIINPRSSINFDFIFCRNTVIYMEKQTKSDLFEALYKKLKPGGFLVLGKTEFLDGTARTKFEPYSIPERIYRKPFDNA